MFTFPIPSCSLRPCVWTNVPFCILICLLCELLCDFRWLHIPLCRVEILVYISYAYTVITSTGDWYAGIILWSWLRVTSPWWQHRWFLTSLPLPRTTGLYSRTWHDWQNPITQGWGRSTDWTLETKTDCVKRVREGATCGPPSVSLKTEQELFFDNYDIVQKCHWQETKHNLRSKIQQS